MNGPACPSDQRPRVVVIGPMAPSVGGMTTVIEQLLSGPLTGSFDFLRRPANSVVTPRRRWWRSIARHVGRLASLAGCLLTRRPDMVHIHTCSGFSFYRSLADTVVSRLLGVPVVLHVHGAQFDQFCAGSGYIGRRLIRWGLNLANRTVVLSQRWREVLSPYAPHARFVEIPNGVAVPEQAPRPRSNTGDQPCRFIFLAAICQRKGIDVLIDAAGRLRDQGIRFRLTIAGPEETPGEAQSLLDHIRRLQLTAQVEYVGTVIGADRDALVDSGDCLVLPSRAEGLPLTLLEAGARGTPVVATTVGAVPEVICCERFGLLAPPGDVDGLSALMAQVATDADARVHMGSALRSRVQARYSLQYQSSLFANLYHELCSRPETLSTGDAVALGGPR